MHEYTAQKIDQTSKAMRYGALSIVTAMAAVLAAGLLLQQKAEAQEAETGQLVVQDVGVTGYEFTVTIHAEGSAGAPAEVMFDDQPSSPVVLEVGSYTLKPMAVAGFGYQGWAMGEAGACPLEPASNEALIPIEVTAGMNAHLCLYHEEGAIDVSALEEQDTTKDGPQAAETPAPPSTGSGLAADGQQHRVSPLLLLAGSVLLISGGVASVSLRRRRRL